MTEQEKKELSFIYKENLESNIIKCLAQKLNIDIREAMNMYYSSRLALQIEAGEYGIENMDFKYLVEDLLENEGSGK